MFYHTQVYSLEITRGLGGGGGGGWRAKMFKRKYEAELE